MGRGRLWAISLAALACGMVTGAASAQGTTEIININGNPAPDGNGVFTTSVSNPAMNESGAAVFWGLLSGTSGGSSDNTGLFMGSVGPLTQVVRSGQAVPGGNGTFISFSTSPSLNEIGQVAFNANLTGTSGGTSDDSGIFLRSGGSLTQVVREGQAAPDGNGAFIGIGTPTLNAAGQTIFNGTLGGTSGGASDNTGVFLRSGETLMQIVREGQAAPGGNGTFESFNTAVLNASGQIAFRGSLTGTIGGTSDNSAVYLSSGGVLTQLARAGETAPDGNGVFNTFGVATSLNASGQVMFSASLSGTSGGTNDNGGVFLSTGGALAQVVREGQAVPDGNGVFGTFGNTMLNDSGEAAFTSTLTGTSGGTSDNGGIFGSMDGTLAQIVRKGQSVPGGNGLFSTFDSLAINASGQVAFRATLTDTSGGLSDDGGIFLANGIDILPVAREGDALAGSTIAGLLMHTVATFNRTRSGLNDFGQVAFSATLDNGNEAIVRFTIPDFHWVSGGSGNWATDANWSGGTEPNSFHHTFIAPSTSLTVTAPTMNTAVASLTLGGGGGVATLRLAGASGGDLRALEASTITSTGVLHLTDGRTFSAPSLTNSGTIRGHGTVDAAVSNAGRIEAIGEELAFSKLVTNAASSGLIAGENATLRFHEGVANHGAVAFSFGTSRLSGDVTNGASGTIAVAGNSNVTFYDDVINNGTLNVVGGSTAVFLGALSGNGNVGSGDVQALGDLSPGASAGVMGFGGNLTLGSLSRLSVELGGVEAGTGYDRVEVAEHVELNGQLAVQLIDGFVSVPGQVFEVLTFGSRNGDVAVINETGFAGLSFSKIYSDDSLGLLATGLGGDANLDGTVSIADLGILAANWQGTDKSWLQADFTGDGVVTIADLGILAANWQAGVGGSHGSAVGFEEAMGMFDPFDKLSAGVFEGVAVPEPGVGLLVLGPLVLGLPGVRRRKGVAWAFTDRMLSSCVETGAGAVE